jgi:hypothetical protein
LQQHERASIYRHDEAYYVASENRTVDGFYVIGQVDRLATSVEDETLGEAILSALAASQEGVPTPAREANVAAALLTLAGSRTWRAFAVAADLVAVEREDSVIRIEQWQHASGRPDAFEPSSAPAAGPLNGPEADGVGSAVRRSFESSTRP